MKKMLYSVLALALLLVVLVVLYVGNIMYQRYSLEDGRTQVSTRPMGHYGIGTAEGMREYHKIEVVCKSINRFNAVVDLSSLFLEGEKEDAPFQTRITLPAQPSKFSLRDGIWISQFYVFIFTDGYAGVSETLFPEDTEGFMQSLVPFELPPIPIVWNPTTLVSGRHNVGNDAGGIVIDIGKEVPVRRISATVWSKTEP